MISAADLSIQYGLPYFWLIPALCCLTIALLTPVARWFQGALFDEINMKSPAWRDDQAEKGSLVQKTKMEATELFELEKRAFFSKTWLFVCHRSRFEKEGDYRTYDVGGIAFFVVMGKDHRLRAFHNVCRHRAYTVVRKPCGTSTRFSCKYHGWQYDDRGQLVKAPKFEEMPGFKPEDNGLFELKLILTREGLVYVNFDASTMHLPFDGANSGFEMEWCEWVDEFDTECKANWKQVAAEFSRRVQASRKSLGWFPRKQKTATLLGPLSVAKDLGGSLWCTLTILPVSSTAVNIRVSMFAKNRRALDSKTREKYKWLLEQEVQNFSKKDESDPARAVPFSYECGGRKIDLSAILAGHQRLEAKMHKKLQPAIQITGHDDVDVEAAELCEALDGRNEPQRIMEPLAKMGSWSRRMEW